MARSHARLLLTVWSDPDWRALPMAEQWMYEALISQPDINHAGVLTLARRRWSQLAVDVDRQTVEGALKGLAAARFVVVDEDTEEVLVRSFIRNDNVHRQPNTLKSALRSAQAVQSGRIRAVLTAELRRLDFAKVSAMRVPAGHEPIGQLLVATLEVLSPGPDEPPPNRSRATPSDGYGEPFSEPFAEGNGVPTGEGEGARTARKQDLRGGALRAQTRATPAPHEPRCEKPCRVCRDARLADEAADAEAEQRAAEHEQAEQLATRRCRWCNTDGWRIDPDNPHRGPLAPAVRCDHRPVRLVEPGATA